MGRHPLDHVAQVDERIDPDALTGLHEREQDRRAVGSRLAPCEEPVFATENDWLDRALRAGMPPARLCRVGGPNRLFVTDRGCVSLDDAA